MTKYRTIIAGGRDYRLTRGDIRFLNGIADQIGEVVTGDCKTGADRDARGWAEFFGIPYEGFPADWDNLGKKAGPIRNSQMISYVCSKDDMPGMLIAFHGGKGTHDITTKALSAKLRVIRVPPLKEDPKIHGYNASGIVIDELKA